MPVQQQNSNLAAKLGGRIAAANEMHKDAPVDTGNRRLPPGIKEGVAKLSTWYVKEQTEDNGYVPRGEMFSRASAIVIYPEQHDRQKIAGMVTSPSLMPLCDMPAKGQRKASTFEQNWFDFQNLFKLLAPNIAPCPETRQTDPTGQKTWAYYMAAMQTLVDPNRLKANPVYIHFSTRAWKAPKLPGESQEAYDKKESMVFETWHGLADEDLLKKAFGGGTGEHDPAAGVTEAPPVPQLPSARAATSPAPTAPAATPPVPADGLDLGDVVTTLVEVAMADPEGTTQEGAEATMELEKLAISRGWTEEHITKAADWGAVGDMALNPPSSAPAAQATPATQPSANGAPKVGSQHNFQKRGRDGSKLKTAENKELPPIVVEVVDVDEAAKTCTVKNAKDGKVVVDFKSKKPVAVQFGWLEPTIPY
jgi:hypothetical protein